MIRLTQFGRRSLFDAADLAAVAGYKALVIVVVGVLTWLGFRKWPRVFVALIARLSRTFDESSKRCWCGRW